MGPTLKNSAKSSTAITQKFFHLAGRRNLSSPGPQPKFPPMPDRDSQLTKSDKEMTFSPAASFMLALDSRLLVDMGVCQASHSPTPTRELAACLKAFLANFQTTFKLFCQLIIGPGAQGKSHSLRGLLGATGAEGVAGAGAGAGVGTASGAGAGVGTTTPRAALNRS